MARKREDHIREEVISALMGEIDTHIRDSVQTSTHQKDLEENPIDPSLLSIPLPPGEDDNSTLMIDESANQVATEILHPEEAPSNPIEPHFQKTEILAQDSLATVVPAINKYNKAPSSLPEPENPLQQIHYLKIAQDKITMLESEVDRLREENDLLVIAAQASRRQAEELSDRLTLLERERVESLEQAQMELNIFRENLAVKEKDRKLLEERIRQLEGSVSKEIKKTRVRERELENRLEIIKQEKSALLRSKDEAILDLRRRIDDLSMEIDHHRSQYAELRKKSDLQHGQLSRTVKALRLALAHLESEGEDQVPFKKAE